jgi:hypothetical protein
MKSCSALFILILALSHCGAQPAGQDWFSGQTWLGRGVSMTADGVSIEVSGTAPILLRPAKPVEIPAEARRLTLCADPAALGRAAPWRQEKPGVFADIRDARGVVRRFPFCLGDGDSLQPRTFQSVHLNCRGRSIRSRR